jgi:hypothetical protein
MYGHAPARRCQCAVLRGGSLLLCEQRRLFSDGDRDVLLREPTGVRAGRGRTGMHEHAPAARRRRSFLWSWAVPLREHGRLFPDVTDRSLL